MLYFENDYCEGAHPAILQKLAETNFEKVPGYGTDPYCASAKEKIRAACACPEADVQFISGGTQSNAIVIASMLQRWQGVVAAATGHVAGHEAGAIEYTGHKVITLPQHNGKLDAAELRALAKTLEASGGAVRLDLSLAGEMEYYNGLVFQGYLKALPRPLLKGGRYDLLLQKFTPGAGAIGFAVYLDELDRLMEEQGLPALCGSPSGVPFLARPRRQEIFACFDRCRFLDLL